MRRDSGRYSEDKQCTKCRNYEAYWVRVRERLLEYGDSTCERASYSEGESRLQQQNVNNGWYFNLNNGNTNTNNKTNAYAVFPFSECSERLDRYFVAERECFSNKRSKWIACKSHYHLSEIWELIDEIDSGEYKPRRSLCFIVSYPTYREVFASEYLGRVVHHLIAPYITQISEQVHIRNGNVTHGNRLGYSAYTAALQVQEQMRKKPAGVVYKFDISGFFMSISRKIAYDVFCKYEQMYHPGDISEEERKSLLQLVKVVVYNDPTIGCVRRCDISEWKNIPDNKTLFKSNGRGLPIGNFPSQLLAVLLLAILDEALHITHFVDDFCGIADTAEDAHEQLDRARSILSSIELNMHKKKVYIQPLHHGVSLCGYVVYPDRIYIANRTKNAAKNAIMYWLSKQPSISTAERLVQCFNSYTGLMAHVRAFNIQRDLMEMVRASELYRFVDFKEKLNHIICRIRKEYRYESIYNNDIQLIKSQQYGSNSSRTHRGLPSRRKEWC